MSEERAFAVKQTNVSRPQISHSNSKQSISASEHYYSASENSQRSDDSLNLPSRRDDSDAHSQRTVVRYATPPSKAKSNEPLPTQASSSAMRSSGARPVSSSDAQPVSPVSTRKIVGGYESSVSDLSDSQEHEVGGPEDKVAPDLSTHPAIAVEPASSATPSTQIAIPMNTHSPMTTPGVDDTPYIRFAIDQLTRDEEVRGSRRYPQSSTNDDYPIERIVPDEGLGYTSGQREAVDQRQLDSPSPEALPQRGSPWHQEQVEQQQQRQQPPAPPPALRSSNSREVFLPFYPTESSYQCPPLNFLPGVLRPVWLTLFFILCFAIFLVLLVAAILSLRRDGLWGYGTIGDNRYFTFEYLPQLLGMIVLVWLFQIEIAILRVAPFKCLASSSIRSRAEGPLLDMNAVHFLLPNFQLFRAGQPLLGGAFITFWLFIFSIPLLSGTFNVYYYPSGWKWVASQALIWPTIFLFLLLLIGIGLVMVAFSANDTGLKWDPRSLADIIVLLARANNLGAYSGSETFTSIHQFVHRLINRADRIGYWNTSKRPGDIFYGIGAEGASTRKYSIDHGRIREKSPDPFLMDEGGDLERGERHPDDDDPRDVRSRRLRTRFLPWFLRGSSVLLWILAAFALLIAFLVVSFVHNPVLDGFAPKVDTIVDSHGFSASNTLFSLVPTLLGLLLFLGWTQIDLTVRRQAPYAALAHPNGSPAEYSLLVDYAARLPLSATIAAASNGHFLPAITSILAITSATIPVLAGGVFWTQYYPNAKTGSLVVRIAAEQTGYYALAFFLALYALGFLVLLMPDRKRAALPIDASRNLASTISMLYQSNLLADRSFHSPSTRAELVSRLLGPQDLRVSKKHHHSNDSRTLRTWRSWASLRGWPEPEPAQAPGEYPDNPAPTGPEPSAMMTMAEAESLSRHGMRASAVVEDGVTYGLGVFIGRDGREHMGIDRIERAGRRMEGY